MRSAVRTTVVVVLGALVALSWTPAATAFENEAFGITPFPERTNGSDRSSFSIPLETGATFEDAVRVYNLTDEPLALALYATDAQAALDDTISVGLREEHPEGVGSWIDLPLKRIELGARDAKTVSFSVKVRSSDPEPELGAIVVESTDRDLVGRSAQRLHVLVRTVPPNTQTSSKRVRTFLVQSRWATIALLGLVLAGALVWLGARRARRPRDLVVQPGSLTQTPTEAEVVPRGSRPAVEPLGSPADRQPRPSVFDRVRASAGARRRDDRPLLDDPLLVEVDEDEASGDGAHEDDASPGPPSWARTAVQRETPAERKPAGRRKTGAAKRAPSASKRAAPSAASAAKRQSSAKRTGAKATVEPRPAAKRSKAKAARKPKPKAKAKAATRKPKPPQDKNFIPLNDL